MRETTPSWWTIASSDPHNLLQFETTTTTTTAGYCYDDELLQLVHATPRRSHSGSRRRPTTRRRQRSVSPTPRGSSSRRRRRDLDADEERVERERREREAEAGRQQTTSTLDRIILTQDRIHNPALPTSTPTLMPRRLRLRHTKPTNNDQRRRSEPESSSLSLFRPFPPTLPHWHIIRGRLALERHTGVRSPCLARPRRQRARGRGLCQPPTCPRTSASQLPVLRHPNLGK
ncbi:hypothetical protein C8F01DRAFT_161496 [Mycena amicta]|nr:hypothetical protein C8F01DRAFT_161496 [Mycena amicta]